MQLLECLLCTAASGATKLPNRLLQGDLESQSCPCSSSTPATFLKKGACRAWEQACTGPPWAMKAHPAFSRPQSLAQRLEDELECSQHVQVATLCPLSCRCSHSLQTSIQLKTLSYVLPLPTTSTRVYLGAERPYVAVLPETGTFEPSTLTCSLCWRHSSRSEWTPLAPAAPRRRRRQRRRPCCHWSLWLPQQ